MAFLFYFGGYAPIGGIETFAHSFLLELGDRLGARELMSWGQSTSSHPLLHDLQAKGVRLTHSRWRWGCRWRWPDKLLLRRGLSAVNRADYVLFGKNFSLDIQRQLRSAADARAQVTGRRIPFVLVTPYRPLELWGPHPDLNMLATFDAIVVQAEQFEADLREAGFTGRVEVGSYLPPVPPVTPCPMPLVSNVIRIGVLCRLEPDKNIAYLLDAFALLVREAQYELHIFGDGSQRAALEAQTRALTIDNHVRFHGVVRGQAKSTAINECHLFANSSLTEGQPLASLEVLGAGRPLVATPVGCHPDMLADHRLGAIAPLHDAPGYAAVVRDLAESIRAGRRTAESVRAAYDTRYARQTIMTQYIDLFGELAAQPQ